MTHKHPLTQGTICEETTLHTQREGGGHLMHKMPPFGQKVQHHLTSPPEYKKQIHKRLTSGAFTKIVAHT